MSATLVARNYAEALLALAQPTGSLESYADLLDAVASAMETSPDLQTAFVSPRVPKARKVAFMAAALAGAPRPFSLLMQAVVTKGRQRLLRMISNEYNALVDVELKRVRANVTVAREPDAALRAQVKQSLEQALKKEVVPTFRVDPAILGGTVVRIGDRVHDGSLRRKLARLRRELLANS